MTDPLRSSDGPRAQGDLERCRAGDRAALERVLRAELPALERHIGGLIGPDRDLDDLVQRTLVRAVRAFPKFRGEAPVRLWLARIATNVVIDHLRTPQRRREVPLRLVVDSSQTPAAEPSAERVVDARARLRRVFHHLDRLSPKNRTAFILHVIEGRPVHEVAALMKTSQVTTRSRVFLARRSLRAWAHRDPALRDLFEVGGDR